ncbi:MAG: carbon starvation protein A [Chlorobi bacterium]|nr:carbon starvation protein A [Chlorobiota bacterium]
MSATVLVLISLLSLVTAYFTYGSFIARRLHLSNKNATPAHTRTDGVDYVPTSAPVLLGHHFASIAGASPIVGPIIAVTFGWIPAILWILLGGIFFGSVHDFTSLVASVRHQGRSIGDVIEEYIGVTGKRLFILFSFATLVLVVGVFTDIVARTFVSIPSVATSSALFLLLAVIFGFSVYRMKLPLLPTSVAGVVVLFACVWLGMEFPIYLGYDAWVYILLAYIFVAAVTPLWILLQPRDYLNSFLLYAVLLGGIIGLVVTNPDIKMEGFGGLYNENLGYMFPILFVTIACGAISGFHSLVASGTTSKQLNRETDAKLVGYGGMLIEVLLAVLALISVMVLTRGEYEPLMKEHGPVYIFAHGIGRFLTTLGFSEHTGITFVSLAVSAFALTSLDTCTRLMRFLFQEFFESRSRPDNVLHTNRFIGTGVAVFLGGALTLSGQFSQVWPIFGSANQLLAALALLAVAVWLSRKGMKNWFVVVPMVFMFAVTTTALATLLAKNFAIQNWALAIMALLLLLLSVVLLYRAVTVLRKPVHDRSTETGAGE